MDTCGSYLAVYDIRGHYSCFLGHMFSAGYELRTEEQYQQTSKQMVGGSDVASLICQLISDGI